MTESLRRGAVVWHSCERGTDCRCNDRWVRIVHIKRNGEIIVAPVEAGTWELLGKRLMVVCQKDTLFTTKPIK